jgi:transglutaminase-like putative cysteine protease
MYLRIGFELGYNHFQPTPMVLMLSVFERRRHDLCVPDTLDFSPALASSTYRDGFGNHCTRIVAPAGPVRITADAVIADSGVPDAVAWDARQIAVEDLPHETLRFLLGSRYCETDLLSDIAWRQFGNVAPGWSKVQAICDFVHGHLQFGYQHARPTKTAWEAYNERRGVCRDFAHLAITLCRCMNIPARYCTGYLGDIGVPPVDAPMDFSGWFEAFLDGRWYTFDARHNIPRIGRVPIAYGRDAADVAISTAFGASHLTQFRVWTDEVDSPDAVSEKLLHYAG